LATPQKTVDQETADKFANSWNHVYNPSVYTREQVLDWISPWQPDDIKGQSVLELGSGSGALLHHLATMKPKLLQGVDLGSSVNTAQKLLGDSAQLIRGDITQHQKLLEQLGQQDRCYSIGVLHHLKQPRDGFESLLRLTKKGGHFHAWVYAHEGNALIRGLVDPLRKLVNHLPWWINKYAVAWPLSWPFLAYSKICCLTQDLTGKHDLPLPLYRYMLWIGQRDFHFHHHVAFDQLVTPTTHYIHRSNLELWLNDDRIIPNSRYIEFRNGNSWKFGGQIKS
jgi:SAM-dependent methyltransferase